MYNITRGHASCAVQCVARAMRCNALHNVPLTRDAPRHQAEELTLPRGALAPDDMRRVHAWLEAEHAKGAKSVRAPELYAPTLDDCAGIVPAADGSGLLDFEAEAVRDL